MKRLLIFYAVLLIPIAIIGILCKSNWGPRVIDWKEEWGKSKNELKDLTREIKENINGKYKIGNNDFPSRFDYPFDEGFYIGYGSQDTINDSNKISIKFYVDRGFNHFSAFIYTKDTIEIKDMEFKLKQN